MTLPYCRPARSRGSADQIRRHRTTDGFGSPKLDQLCKRTSPGPTDRYLFSFEVTIAHTMTSSKPNPSLDNTRTGRFFHCAWPASCLENGNQSATRSPGFTRCRICRRPDYPSPVPKAETGSHELRSHRLHRQRQLGRWFGLRKTLASETVDRRAAWSEEFQPMSERPLLAGERHTREPVGSPQRRTALIPRDELAGGCSTCRNHGDECRRQTWLGSQTRLFVQARSSWSPPLVNASF